MSEIPCKSCGYQDIQRFLSLGTIPPVNAFIAAEQIADEKKYPLNLAYCPHCFLVQLEEIVPPEELFRNYLHLSAGSQTNVAHLKEVADYLGKKFKLDNTSKVLEIGSNDGTLLSFFKDHTLQVLGVDPAQNLVEVNEKKGIDYLPEFFTTGTASKIVKSKGQFDLVVALNVIPHTPNNIDLLKAVRIVLKDTGTLVMEGVYALETILNGEFDTIYHEHVYTFSLHSLIATFRMAGLTVVDVERLPTQGGSLRVCAMKDEFATPVSESVKKLMDQEEKKGLANSEIYRAVGPKVESYRKEIRQLINREKASLGKLIGLGAPARGVVILNYCNIETNDLEYIIDDTPLKIGKLAPGVHVPIKSWEALNPNEERAFLLLSWNYKDHLISKLRQHVTKARIIIPFPKLEVLHLD